MSRLHRFLLLCFLAVALPIQGFAAAATAHCDAGSFEASSEMGMDDTADMEMSQDADMHDHAMPQGVAHKGSCSACAACCVVAAPGISFSLSIASAPTEVVEVATMRPRVAFLTDGPERPPRNSLT